jgi:hypothetical protein
MAGNGTTALELIEESGPLDLLLVCLGGGGLLAGCATAATALSPGIAVWGVEPDAGDDWAQSFARGARVRLSAVPRTIADGQQTEAPGLLTWLYNNTGGSVFAAVLLHATGNLAQIGPFLDFGPGGYPLAAQRIAALLILAAATVVVLVWGLRTLARMSPGSATGYGNGSGAPLT